MTKKSKQPQFIDELHFRTLKQSPALEAFELILMFSLSIATGVFLTVPAMARIFG